MQITPGPRERGLVWAGGWSGWRRRRRRRHLRPANGSRGPDTRLENNSAEHAKLSATSRARSRQAPGSISGPPPAGHLTRAPKCPRVRAPFGPIISAPRGQSSRKKLVASVCGARRRTALGQVAPAWQANRKRAPPIWRCLGARARRQMQILPEFTRLRTREAGAHSKNKSVFGSIRARCRAPRPDWRLPAQEEERAPSVAGV